MTNLELRRDPVGAKVAGVCAGLARSWNVDPLLVRLAFVVLAVVTNGFAVIAYLAVALLLPERGSTTEPIRDLVPFTRPWSRDKLLVVTIIAASLLGLAVASTPGSLLIALVVLALVRWGRRSRPATPPTAPAPRTEFERLAATWSQRLDNVAVGLPPDWTPTPTTVDPDPHGLYGAPDAPAKAPRHPARRRRAVRTWSGVAVALGLTWTGLGVLQATGTVVPTLAWCAATLGVLAVALVLVARPSRATFGRPPGLLPATVVVALTTGAVLAGAPGVVATGLPQPAGTTIRYAATAQPADHHFDMGSATVDLSDLTIDRDHRTRLATDMGSLRVVLPREGNVVVHYGVDMGSVQVAGQKAGGFDTAATWQRITDPAAPTLTLDLRVDLGSLEVVTP